MDKNIVTKFAMLTPDPLRGDLRFDLIIGRVVPSE